MSAATTRARCLAAAAREYPAMDNAEFDRRLANLQAALDRWQDAEEAMDRMLAEQASELRKAGENLTRAFKDTQP